MAGGGNNVSIPQLIGATQGNDNHARNTAQKQLEYLESSHFANYMLELCRILGSPTESESVRQGAGLLLKNCVGGNRSQAVVDKTRQRWHSLDLTVRNKLKGALLKVLGLPSKEARSTAVNVVSNLALVETLANWSDLIPDLIRKCRSQNSELMFSGLKCIGQIAENESTHDDLTQFSGQLLECIAHGMSSKSGDVQSESMKCLAHIIELIEANMKVEKERNIIFQMLCCGASSTPNKELRLFSFMCMQRVIEAYYDLTQMFMQNVFQISKSAIERGIAGGEDEDVTKQAIEVWSTTAEMELSRDGDKHFGFVNKALQQLVPVYLKGLLKQRDTFDEDDWSVRKAAACSLETFALVAKDNILNYVLSFVEKNIGLTDWRNREAALCAFGYVLDGPSAAKLETLVSQILKPILALTSDDNKQVRITAVWTFGRICEHVPKATDPAHNSAVTNADVMQAIVRALNDIPPITNKACWCIASLTRHGHAAIYSGKNTYNIISELLRRETRPDLDNTLVIAIHEAINGVICGLDLNKQPALAQMLLQLMPELMKQMLAQVDALQNTANRSAYELNEYRVAGLLSSVQVTLDMLCQAKIQCLDEAQSNQMMHCLMRCAQISNNGSNESTSLVYEEALGLITHISRAIGTNFYHYLSSDAIQKMLLQSIDSETMNLETCRIGVGAIGDVYCQCGAHLAANPSKMQAYTDQVVSKLLNLLEDTGAGIDLKSHIIDALTDILIAFGNHGHRYSADVLQKCLAIGCYQPPLDVDIEIMTSFNDIRCSIVDTVRTCLAELAQANKISDFGQYVPKINAFFKAVSADLPRINIKVLRSSIQLLSEVADYCVRQAAVKQQLRTPYIQKILEAAHDKRDENAQLANEAKIAFEQLAKE